VVLLFLTSEQDDQEGIKKIKRAMKDSLPNPSTISDADHIGSSNRYILEDETYAIIGAAMEVYYKLGNGFAEPVYQEALAIEFGLRDVVFESQKRLQIDYKGHTLNKGYIADFLCFGQIIVEIKAISQLTSVDWSQIMNYLKATQLRVGLLFNFGSSGRLEKKRIVI
jgi:GxxExxY protein